MFCCSFFVLFLGWPLYCLSFGFSLPIRYLLWSTSLWFTLASIQMIYLIINSASHTWFLTHFKYEFLVLNFDQSVILDPPTFFYQTNQKECYSRFVSILIYFLYLCWNMSWLDKKSNNYLNSILSCYWICNCIKTR